MRIGRGTRAVARLAGGAMLLMGSTTGATAQMELGGSRLAISGDELRALSDLGNIARSGSRAFQDRALAEARRIVKGGDGRHVLALYELEIGQRRGDDAMRAGALDVLIASAMTAPVKIPDYLRIRGQIAYRSGDHAAAEAAWTRLATLVPADADVLASLAQVADARSDHGGALRLLSRAIALRSAAGGAAPEGWYRQRLSIVQRGRLAGAGAEAALSLVRAYPVVTNWRDAMMVYRQLAPPEGAFEIDLLRFARHASAMTRQDEYQRMAQLLKRAGQPREARTVLDEGLARGLLDPAGFPTSDIIAEVDRAITAPPRPPASAAELPRAAVQVRLGAAEAMAGRRDAAEAAFRAVADDPVAGRYAELAAFWRAWLARADPPTPAGDPLRATATPPPPPARPSPAAAPGSAR